jgi:cysteinyl-tRNA synthetase
VQARTDARASKDFARADSLRAELSALGVEVLDTQDASSWRITI